jgi:hypothetical protein
MYTQTYRVPFANTCATFSMLCSARMCAIYMKNIFPNSVESGKKNAEKSFIFDFILFDIVKEAKKQFLIFYLSCCC